MFTITIRGQAPITAEFIGTVRTDGHPSSCPTLTGRQFLEALRAGDAVAADRIFSDIGFGLVRDISTTDAGALAAEIIWGGVPGDMADEDGESFASGAPVLIRGDVALVKAAGNRISVLRVLGQEFAQAA